MKLASHNSLTYLPVKKWWMKIFRFVAKCQRKSIYQQYKLGIRMFDIRVAFDYHGDPYICHGLIDYKGSINEILKYMNTLKDVRVRLILEKWDNHCSAYLFSRFCKECETLYSNIKFFGGVYKKTWNLVYNFKYSPQYDDKYASNNTKEKTSGFILDDVWPYIYARLNNKKNIEKGTDKPWLFIDFVDIR